MAILSSNLKANNLPLFWRYLPEHLEFFISFGAHRIEIPGVFENNFFSQYKIKLTVHKNEYHGMEGVP